ncbi:hypothetical protein BAU15_14150 [Enterococcus sp. JM4C]|uniref:EpsG family protein n=1 Tax=Candidatus Enterococcus huntleyi TaxID=1857217 RepID=UPI00137B41B6|nr:EpsG family protein [Enterococcus sp. JM4C]KAF1298821.1 hypothetical protein BAU15_14150 [Enterococcus sp. JM4C]
MGLYIMLFIYLLVLYLINITLFPKKNCSLLAILPFFILSAFRDSSIGNDTMSYLAIFDRVKLSQIDFQNTNFEAGYMKLNQIVAFFFSDLQSILIVTSILIYLGYYFFIRKYSVSPIFSVVLFISLGYFSNSLNILRQQIALSIIFVAWYYLNKSKTILPICLILLATLFHNTALIFILAILLRKVKVNKLSLSVLFATIFIGYFAYAPFLRIFIRIFPIYNSYLGSIYMSGEIRMASVMNAVILLLILLLGLIFKPDKDSEEFSYQLWNTWTIYIMVSIGLTVLSFNFNLIARAAEYFSVFSIVYIPILFKSIKNKNLKILMSFSVIVFAIIFFFFIQVYKPEWNVIYPYKFYR